MKYKIKILRLLLQSIDDTDQADKENEETDCI